MHVPAMMMMMMYYAPTIVSLFKVFLRVMLSMEIRLLRWRRFPCDWMKKFCHLHCW